MVGVVLGVGVFRQRGASARASTAVTCSPSVGSSLLIRVAASGCVAALLIAGKWSEKVLDALARCSDPQTLCFSLLVPLLDA